MSYAATKKWRIKNPKKVRAQKIRYYKKSEKTATASHQIWTISDINKILTKIFGDATLALLLGRSVKAIQVKRSALLER